MERGSLSEQIQGAVALGQFQNPTECEHSRRLPCGQLLRAAVAEELRHRRSPSPKQKTAAGLAVGQHRRPGLAARRSAPAHPRIRARSPSLKCRSTHTPQPPLGQRFRSARAEQSHSSAPAPPDRKRWPRGAALARTRKREANMERGSLSEQIQGAVALGQFQNPTECEHSRRLPCGQLLRAAVAEELRHRRSPSPKQKTAAGLAVGQHRRPGLAARRSAPAHPRIRARSPSLKCRSTHTPQPPLGQRFRSARAEQSHSSAPAPPDRKRWPRGAALARTRKREANMERGSLSEQIQGAVALGQFQNPTECEHSRRLPCGQLLRAAVAEELRHRRSPSPKQKTAAGLAVGQHRRPGLAARRSAPAHPRIRARSPSLKCRSTHTPQPPLGQRFRSARAEQSHSSAPAPPDRKRWPRGAALARTRKREANMERGSLSEQIQGAVALGQFQNPTECEHSRRLPCGQLLRAAVAEELRHRRSPSPKQKTAAGLAVGQHRRPGLAARRSAPAHPRIRARSPSLKCRSTHTPQPPLGQRFRSARAEQSHSSAPAPPDRKRWPRGAALARTRKREANMERGSLSEQIQGAVALGRFQNPTECEHSRRLPCGQLLRAAVAEELRHRRSPSPKQKTAAGLAVGQHRRPGLAARRSAPAHPRIRARSPSLKCRSTHTPQPPLGQRFRSARADTVPIAPRRRRRIENAGRGVPPSRARGNAKPTWNAVVMPCCCDRPGGEAYPIARPPRRRCRQPNRNRRRRGRTLGPDPARRRQPRANG